MKNKDTRLFARISSLDKDLIERAAAIIGQSAATFVVTQAREAAARLIEQERLIELSEEESRRVVKALLTPKSPNAAFKAALQDYRDTVVSDVNPSRTAKRVLGKRGASSSKVRSHT